MKLEFNDDQAAYLQAVQRVAERHSTPPTHERVQYAHALDADLSQAGLLDAMTVEELGGIAAAAAVIELSRLRLCSELSASALIAPWLCPELPRPFALAWDGDRRPLRFLPVAATVLLVREREVLAARLLTGQGTPDDGPFAYPAGRLARPEELDWQTLDADAGRVRTAWRIGIACELAGALAAAHDEVLEHLKTRRQFGRALGSFQALQHRMAECAVRIEGMRWLALKAAGSFDPLDAALAAANAQDAARRVCYDLHQFMGAMGLTLEHPLHRWTYRAKALAADLGGADRQFAVAARAAWDGAVPLECSS